MSIPGRQPPSYYICSGIDPTTNQGPPKPGYGIIEFCSLVLHGFVFARVNKFKIASAGPQISNRKIDDLKDIETTSLTSFSANAISILSFGTGAVYILVVNSSDFKSMLRYPNYLHLYLINLVGPCLVGLCMALFYFARHEPLRRFLKVVLKNNLGLNNPVYPV